MSIEVTKGGLTNVLPATLAPGFTYMVYAMQFQSLAKSREIRLYENGDLRWSGWVGQKQLPLRLDFGNIGWRLRLGSGLNVFTSGSMTLKVNILQWGLLRVGT